MADDFLTDEQMATLESASMPDFIPDAQMASYEAPPAPGGWDKFAGGVSAHVIPAYGDEAFAGLGAIYDTFARGGTVEQNYTPRLAQIRGYQKAYDAASPTGGIAEDILGGAWVPGIKWGKGVANTWKALAAEGALLGGAYGFGAGEDGLINRLKSAGVGTAVGTVAAPVVGKTLEYGLGTIMDMFSRSPAILASERGAVNSVAESFSPEDLVLARELRNTPIEQVRAGANEMTTTISEGVPLFLPEAVNSAKVNRNARFIANYEPSMDYSQTAIGDRTKGAQDRATDIFDAVSPERSSYDGATKFAQGGAEIVQSAEKARLDEAKPLYDAAYTERPIINDPALSALVSNDKYLATAIRDVKSSARNAALPENSTRLLVKAREELSDKIGEAGAKGYTRKEKDLIDTYNRLNEIIAPEGSALHTADRAYEAASRQLDVLNESFLKNLKNMSADKIQNVGQVFNLSPNRISALRDTFIEAGKLDEWNAGIRSHLQNAVDGMKIGRNFTDKISGNTAQQAKLKAALGDSYDSVAKGLGYENRMFEGKNRYHAGSSTEGNQSEAKAFERNIGIVGKLKTGDWMGAIADIFTSGVSDDTAQALARIYFDPSTGAEKIQKILPLLEKYAANKDFAQSIGSLGSRTTTRSGASAEGFSLNPPPSRGASFSSEATTIDTSALKAGTTKAGGFQTNSSSESTPISEVFQRTSEQNHIKEMFKREVPMGRKEDIAATERIIDENPYYSALYEAESSRKPDAKNPISTAKGGFQFIDETAKALKLDDPYDLGKAFTAVTTLTDQHRKRFGDDPIALYSAHYLGGTVYQKVIDGKPLTDKQQAQVDYLKKKALPDFMKIYTRITQKLVEA